MWLQNTLHIRRVYSVQKEWKMSNMLCEEHRLCVHGLERCHCGFAEGCESEDFIKQGVRTLICAGWVFFVVVFLHMKKSTDK